MKKIITAENVEPAFLKTAKTIYNYIQENPEEFNGEDESAPEEYGIKIGNLTNKAKKPVVDDGRRVDLNVQKKPKKGCC